MTKVPPQNDEQFTMLSLYFYLKSYNFTYFAKILVYWVVRNIHGSFFLFKKKKKRSMDILDYREPLKTSIIFPIIAPISLTIDDTIRLFTVYYYYAHNRYNYR